MPPAPGRDYPTDLLLCGHHYGASRLALAAAGAAVYDATGRTVIPPARALVGQAGGRSARRALAGPTDFEGLVGHHRVHRAVELCLGLADHVLPRRPRRDMGQQQLADTGLRRGSTRLGAGQVQRGWPLASVSGGSQQEDIGAASESTSDRRYAGVSSVDAAIAPRDGEPQAKDWSGEQTTRGSTSARNRHRLTVYRMPHVENVRQSSTPHRRVTTPRPGATRCPGPQHRLAGGHVGW